MPKIYIKNREKLIICGLFLAKFDKAALSFLGFSSFIESFNTLGYALGGKPANIKNYRDEFDPYFDNARIGWNKREMRPYCKDTLKKYKDLNLQDFGNLILSFLDKNIITQEIINKALNIESNITQTAKRIATGLAAEQFFMENYSKTFSDFSLLDTRNLACGFDFKLDSKNTFYFVEIKGLNEAKGSFLFTQKEFEIAQKFSQNYCLYIVSNFKEKPKESVFFNPLESFSFKEIKKEITQISYQGVL